MSKKKTAGGQGDPQPDGPQEPNEDDQSGEPDEPEQPAEHAPDYDVGYKKPPRHGQFKKGYDPRRSIKRSRKKAVHMEMGELATEIMREKVIVSTTRGREEMTMKEAAIRDLVKSFFTSRGAAKVRILLELKELGAFLPQPDDDEIRREKKRRKDAEELNAKLKKWTAEWSEIDERHEREMKVYRRLLGTIAVQDADNIVLPQGCLRQLHEIALAHAAQDAALAKEFPPDENDDCERPDILWLDDEPDDPPREALAAALDPSTEPVPGLDPAEPSALAGDVGAEGLDLEADSPAIGAPDTSGPRLAPNSGHEMDNPPVTSSQHEVDEEVDEAAWQRAVEIVRRLRNMFEGVAMDGEWDYFPELASRDPAFKGIGEKVAAIKLQDRHSRETQTLLDGLIMEAEMIARRRRAARNRNNG